MVAGAGFEVYVTVYAVGGTSRLAHDMALERIQQAGGKLMSWTQLLCELQRDWARSETAKDFMNLFIDIGGTAGIQFGYDREEESGDETRKLRGERDHGDDRKDRSNVFNLNSV